MINGGYLPYDYFKDSYELANRGRQTDLESQKLQQAIEARQFQQAREMFAEEQARQMLGPRLAMLSAQTGNLKSESADRDLNAQGLDQYRQHLSAKQDALTGAANRRGAPVDKQAILEHNRELMDFNRKDTALDNLIQKHWEAIQETGVDPNAMIAATGLQGANEKGEGVPDDSSATQVIGSFEDKAPGGVGPTLPPYRKTFMPNGVDKKPDAQGNPIPIGARIVLQHARVLRDLVAQKQALQAQRPKPPQPVSGGLNPALPADPLQGMSLDDLFSTNPAGTANDETDDMALPSVSPQPSASNTVPPPGQKPGIKVRVKHPDGGFGYIPYDQLTAAKAQGFTEAPLPNE